MKTFFAPIQPYNTGFLQVDAEHSIYYEECGNPKGKAVVFLHGGPGSGCSDYHRTFFDPTVYRIVLLDQRGSGRSQPFASLSNNTTWTLVDDLEQLRSKLKIESWVVFGGSWGSTLALCYAIMHPERTKALILRGIFLLRPQEIKWFYQHGAHHIYPDEFERFVAVIPESERHDLVRAYYKRLTSDDAQVQLEAAKAWSRWEGATLSLIQQTDKIDAFAADKHATSLARIECHYFMNNGFMKSNNWILENVHRIRKIPGVIVHGRYDVVCAFENAWDLHKAWPEAKLEIIKDAGHAAYEPGIVDALVRATEDFKAL